MRWSAHTWSRSRSCSWIHFVCWTDDHRVAEQQCQQPGKQHKHTYRDGTWSIHSQSCMQTQTEASEILLKGEKIGWKRGEDLGEWERVMFPFKEQCHSSVYSHPTKDIIWQTQTDLRSVPLAKSTLITLQALVILVSLELWGSDVN